MIFIKKIIRLIISFRFKFLFGLPKTIFFNIHYFGLKRGSALPIILSNRVRLRSVKGLVVINAPIRTGMILLGFRFVPISTGFETSVWNVRGKVTFNGTADFGMGTKINLGKNGKLTFGNNFRITANSAITCGLEIEFGNDCLLSWDILLMDSDGHYIYDEKGNIINQNRKIIIGNKVWIGCSCLILKGSQISDQSIVAANTIVAKKFTEENIIIGGHNTKILKRNITWGGTIM